MSSPQVTVLGVGIMGAGFARAAARSGLSVTGWDRSPAVAAPLAAEGVCVVAQATDAVRDADVVVTMVADGAAVASVMSDHGAFAAMKPGAAWIQMATIGVAGIDRAMQIAATRPEIVFVDAPVSGSKGLAEQKRLVILASGDQARAGDAVKAFFDTIAMQTHWLGPAGQGTRMKLLYNAWLAVLNEGVAEVATLAKTLGVEPQRFASLAAGGPLVPPWAIAKLQKIAANGTLESEFPLRWATKDVGLALEAAGDERAHLPMLNEIDAVWNTTLEEFGGADLSAIYLALQRPEPVSTRTA